MVWAARGLLLAVLASALCAAVCVPAAERRVACYRDDDQLENEAAEPPTPKPDRCPPRPLDAVRINEAAELVQLVETRSGPLARAHDHRVPLAIVTTQCGHCDLQHFRGEEGVELTCFECEPVPQPEEEEEVVLEEEEPEGGRRAAEEPKKPYLVSDGFFDMLEQAARYEKEQARAAAPPPHVHHAPPPPPPTTHTEHDDAAHQPPPPPQWYHE